MFEPLEMENPDMAVAVEERRRVCRVQPEQCKIATLLFGTRAIEAKVHDESELGLGLSIPMHAPVSLDVDDRLRIEFDGVARAAIVRHFNATNAGEFRIGVVWSIDREPQDTGSVWRKLISRVLGRRDPQPGVSI